MEQIRKPLQGVRNILWFNWHFYLLAFALLVVTCISKGFISAPYVVCADILLIVITGAIVISLLVSFYIYDLSDLSRLDFLGELIPDHPCKNINIHAGFDRTSMLLEAKFPSASLHVFDFYDPSRQTEISIRRARKAYPPYRSTKKMDYLHVPLPDNYADHIFLIFSAHEIRNGSDRVIFFKALRRITKAKGKIIVTEHLRNLPNFLAYTLGFFHFYPRSSWDKTFKEAGLKVCKQIKITPFVITFILEKRGVSY